MLNNIVVLFGGVLFSAYSLWLAWKASRVYDKMDELIGLNKELVAGMKNVVFQLEQHHLSSSDKKECGCGEQCNCH